MKPRCGAKITVSVQTALLVATPRMVTYYAPVRAAWPQTTQAQRDEYLAHSPILAALLDFTRPFFEVKNDR